MLHFADFAVEEDFDVCGTALAFEQRDDFVGAAVAKKLAESFFVERDAMLFDECDEIIRSVTGERGFREMWIRGDEIFRTAMNVGEVAATTAGDEDFLADAVGVLEHSDAAAAFAGLNGAHEARGACAEDDCVEFLRQ